jgi:hypothetical protein
MTELPVKEAFSAGTGRFVKAAVAMRRAERRMTAGICMLVRQTVVMRPRITASTMLPDASV